MNTKKYRPYFTLPELKLLQKSIHTTISPDKRGLNQYLNKFISDIESGFRQENHVLKPSIDEKLGFNFPEFTDSAFGRADDELEKQLSNLTTQKGTPQ